MRRPFNHAVSEVAGRKAELSEPGSIVYNAVMTITSTAVSSVTSIISGTWKMKQHAKQSSRDRLLYVGDFSSL